jgi:iron-sulfur cluster repair protein YtfE (RIC family)
MKAKSHTAKSSPGDFVDALDGCHRDILVHLDKLVALVSELQLDGPNDAVRTQARELIAFFSGPAREHNYDEERHVFPALVACDDVEVKRAAETLSEDHAWIEFCWLDIEPQLAVVAAGLSSYDVPALRSAVDAFVKVTRDHMALEESLLFPQLRRCLKPAKIRSIRREMTARRAAGRHG